MKKTLVAMITSTILAVSALVYHPINKEYSNISPRTETQEQTQQKKYPLIKTKKNNPTKTQTAKTYKINAQNNISHTETLNLETKYPPNSLEEKIAQINSTLSALSNASIRLTPKSENSGEINFNETNGIYELYDGFLNIEIAGKQKFAYQINFEKQERIWQTFIQIEENKLIILRKEEKKINSYEKETRVYETEDLFDRKKICHWFPERKIPYIEAFGRLLLEHMKLQYPEKFR